MVRIVGAKFLSEEDRKKYGTIDLNQTYGLIDTTTHDFIQAKGSTPINTDNRIGVIRNMEILRNLNKTIYTSPLNREYINRGILVLKKYTALS